MPPPPAEAPRVRVEQTLDNVALSAGPLLMTRSGRLEQVKPDGTGHAVVGPTGSLHLPADALAVLPPGGRVSVEVEPDRVVLRPADRDRRSDP